MKPPAGIDLDLVRRSNAAYVRRDLDTGLDDLKLSLKKHGPQIPIITTSDYLVIDGARRIRAAELLGWKEYPAVSTDDWWTVRAHLIKTRELEKDGWPHRRLRWLEMDDLIRRILGPLNDRWLRPNTNAVRDIRAKKAPGTEHRRPNLRNRLMVDLEDMLDVPVSDLTAIRAAGGHLLKSPPELRAAIRDLVESEEDNTGQIWSMHAAVIRTVRLRSLVPTAANKKIATDQVSRIEAAIAVLAQLNTELEALSPLNTAIPLDQAERLLRELKYTRRSGADFVKLLSAFVARKQETTPSPSTDDPNQEGTTQ